jgi:glucose-induced degradation protein 8
MNYLVIEGFKDAAEKFSKETRLDPCVNLESIQDRMNIRNALQDGNVTSAIEQVNDLDPEVKKY